MSVQRQLVLRAFPNGGQSVSGLLGEVPSGVGWDHGHLSGARESASTDAHYRAGKVVLAVDGDLGPFPHGPLHTADGFSTGRLAPL